MKALYGEAYHLLSAPGFRRAFDLGQEPEAVRDAYGRHRSGQACLLGRRLVEAGVPYVAVLWNHAIRGQDRAPDDDDAYGWDTHNDIFTSLKDRLLPRFDRSFSALLTDLEQRGLLDTTLVVCMGEFGRAPRVAREATFAGGAAGASTGRPSTPSCWPGPAWRAAASSAPPTASAATPPPARSARGTWPPLCSPPSASIRPPPAPTPPAAPSPSRSASRSPASTDEAGGEPHPSAGRPA